MQNFRYRAYRPDGTVVSGMLAATDAVHLLERLRSVSGMELVWCRRQKRSQQLAVRQSIDFLFQLRHSIAAGVPLLESLQAQSAERGRAAELAANIANQIEGGTSLADAMAASGMFDEVTIAMIGCGESAGSLVPVLDGLIESMQHRDELSAQFKRGLIQPLTGFVAVLAVMLTMSVWLAPSLETFLESMGQPLPQHTKVLLVLLHAPVTLWQLWLLLALLLPAVWFILRCKPGTRLVLDRMLLLLPVFGRMCTAASLARLSSMLQLLYSAGMSLPEAMDKASTSVSNTALRHALQHACDGMRAGRSLVAALRSTAIMPPLLLRIVAAGERAGTLEASFTQLCYLYTRELREYAARISAMVTPAMTLVLGIMLVWCVLAFISPVYELVLSLPV